MRIATSQYQSTLIRTMQFNESRLAKLTEQMSSGARVPLPSDDPISSVRLSHLTREEAMVTQYQDNISALKIRLQKNESYLSGINADLAQARDQLVWALDGSNVPDDLQAMVGTLNSLKKSILATANSKDQEGRYIFSGTLTNVQPIAEDLTLPIDLTQPIDMTRYIYSGNTGQQQVVVGNGVTQNANVDISGLEKILSQLDRTMAVLSVPGAISTLRQDVADTLDGVDVAMDLVGGKIAILGGTQNTLSTLASNHTNVSLSNQTAIIDIGRIDYAGAASDLSGYTMAMEATQKAYAKVSQLSLFDLL